jgi:DNA-binding Lrp family transcriptional regulator
MEELHDSPAGHRHDGMLLQATGLSELDRRIIRALQLDGRVSYTALGPQLGTTEKVVRARVQSLLASGVIDITTVTRPQALGYRFVAIAGIRVVGGGREAIVEKLSRVGNVDYLVTTLGRYGILVEILTRTLAELGDIVDREIAPMEGVAGVDVYPFLDLRHQQGAFGRRPADADDRIAPAEREPLELDEIDAAILQRLNANGRAPFLAIGRELGLPEAKVRRRVGRMRARGAVQIMAITNPMSLGFEVVAMIGITVQAGSRATDVADRLAAVAAVSYVAVCTGGFDLLVEAVCLDTEDFLRVMDDELRATPGVASLEPFLYLGLRYRRVSPLAAAEDAGA